MQLGWKRRSGASNGERREMPEGKKLTISETDLRDAPYDVNAVVCAR
jgi:hypothetical protein